MRVVVTRPEASAHRTVERLRVLGHEPVLLPLTRAVHHTDVAEQALTKPHMALAVTSAEAIRVLGPSGGHLDETLYAVGEATAAAAGKVGFRDVRTGPGTGADLADFIAADRVGTMTPLLYLAGRPRSPGFEERLRLKQLSFAVAEIYEMLPVAHGDATLRQSMIEPPADAVLLYSSETARLFFDLTGSFLTPAADLQIICLSANVAENVPQEFHRNIKIAGHPDEDGIFALL